MQSTALMFDRLLANIIASHTREPCSLILVFNERNRGMTKNFSPRDLHAVKCRCNATRHVSFTAVSLYLPHQCGSAKMQIATTHLGAHKLGGSTPTSRTRLSCVRSSTLLDGRCAENAMRSIGISLRLSCPRTTTRSPGLDLAERILRALS